MPDPAVNKAPTETPKACGVEMREFNPCGRPIHPAMSHDKNPVCLMHSKDPAKSDVDFQAEFDRILEEAERAGVIADFSGFVFSTANYRGRTFSPPCLFIRAIFTDNAGFGYAAFTQDTDFGYATFTQDADFGYATFTGSFSFNAVTVTMNASFNDARFFQNADFNSATFTQETDFQRATFNKDANFTNATFNQDANFNGATFTGDADFGDATFIQNADFQDAWFTLNADFINATFTQDATFDRATFTQNADFMNATFTQAFFSSTFSGSVSFWHATFSGAAKFRETRFGRDPEYVSGLYFSDVKLEAPEKVQFYKTDLREALLYNTDVSKIDFTLVEWRDRERTGWLRHFGRRYWGARFCLFEEDVTLLPDDALRSSVDSRDERNYSLIAETYQQLKRNYDAKGDYWTAGHWHYGEMEMKRLHSRWRSRPLRWLSRHFSLVALYKNASEYGESYTVPLAWLLGVVAIFAILYPIAGLELSKDSGGGLVGYWNFTEFFRMHPAEHPSGWLGLILHGFMTSISVAGFQRELKYAPSYPWGRFIALLELLLTTTLGALFALAIRRQFKRS
jgi:uncharacterized protein YjbI with pentapeptide repeats